MMDMSQHPAAEIAHEVDAATTAKEARITRGYYILAALLVSALGGAFAAGGLAYMTMVMVGLVPVYYTILVMIAWGK